MGKSQREKGKVGERDLCHTLNEVGLPGPEFRRGRQYAGHPDAPDIVGGPANLHWECKRCERVQIKQWMAKAVEDAGDKLPVVAFRWNGGEWLACVRLADLKELAASIAGKDG
jgi:Holliday junction resolvase